MDNLFVWIVMFAGAVIALLGIFLLASEKELKVKRREIDELLTRLENGPQENSTGQLVTPQPNNSAELAELRARNQDLQNQLRTLTGKLELSARTIEELQATRHSTDAARATMQELHAANDRLKTEVDELRNRLQASEAHITGSAAGSQDADDRHAQLQREMMALKHELEESHAKLRELSSLQQKLASVDALEERHREERHRLESRIAELEKEISLGQENVRELESLRDRLAQSERIQETLRHESRQHDEEIARWRERIADGEENRRRLASLQAPYDQLIAKQAALAEQQREFQDELAGFARMMALPAQEKPPMSSPSHSSSPAGEHSTGADDKTRASAMSPAVFANPLENGTQGPSSIAPQGDPAAAPEHKTPRRFGIFSAIIILAAAAVLGSQYLNPNAGEPTTPAVVASAPRVTVASVTALSSANQPTAIEPATVTTTSMTKDASKPAVNENREAPKPPLLAKQEPRAVGTYEITRASRVYAAPTESSELIGEIEPGVKVNVVDTRDGWFEIHSKHGRPPGFIRREVAARVAGRN
jgi:predicted  nucleic acid-binding Zn-ribbon protein